jgi:flagellar basal body-associated protein FliL
MAEEEPEVKEIPVNPKKGGKKLLPIILVVLLLGGGGAFFMLNGGKNKGLSESRTLVEYAVSEGVFQLKNGSYLRLSFSIVLDEKFLMPAQDILENSSPARLSDGLNSILGNKTREELIGSSLRRENFRMEIKKILETYVFQEYNRQQHSPKDVIEVREVLLQTFVTQGA